MPFIKKGETMKKIRSMLVLICILLSSFVYAEWTSYQLTDDNYAESNSEGSLQIIPRAVELLDYTLGGADTNPTSAALDNGAGDEIVFLYTTIWFNY